MKKPNGKKSRDGTAGQVPISDKIKPVMGLAYPIFHSLAPFYPVDTGKKHVSGKKEPGLVRQENII
ncbi:MAG: hypothetical protein WC799_16740 [Desulfobacteraceae bacterium]|jgi:hypothetical protein